MPGFWILPCLLTAALLVTGCGEKSATPIYRIGIGPWIGFGPFYLAQEKGFFKEAGVKVQTIVLTGLAERNSALKSGRIDAIAAPVDYFVLLAGNGIETTIVMAIDESVGGDGIVAKRAITKIKDLRGKRVAFQRGLPSEFFLRVMLAQHGMTLEDVDAVEMETTQAGAAFIANQLDAATLWEPWLTKVREQSGANLIASTREHRDLIIDVLAFTHDAIARAPRDVQAIVDAIFKAIEFWKLQPDQANAMMAPYFQIDAEKYKEILQGLKFCDFVRNRDYFLLKGDRSSIFHVAERASTIWQKAEVIEEQVTPASVISSDFVKNAR